MPTKPPSKLDRQYAHIKAAEQKQGRSAKDSSRIAAATINKQKNQRKGR